MSVQIIRERISESISIKQALLCDETLHCQLEDLARACLHSLRAGGKIIFAGNGGSFADAQHLSAEFTSKFLFERSPLPSLALGTNSSAMSAIGNDFGYEQVFARELRGVALPSDVFIGISTSGNSPNILAAMLVAKEINIQHVAWTGQTGGKLDELCSCLKVPSQITARIQECHMILGHILCELVENQFFRKA